LKDSNPCEGGTGSKGNGNVGGGKLEIRPKGFSFGYISWWDYQIPLSNSLTKM
jgi:hypothetical protein